MKLFFAQFLLLISTTIYSQHSYSFRTFSPKGGFYYDGVQSIIQDNDGFIWILLENDLQRFDGYEYKRYTSDFQNPDISNLYNIVKDTAGVLYVSSSNGLFRYDKLTDSFTKYMNEPVLGLDIDRHNIMWCTFNGLLYKLSLADKTLKECRYKDKSIWNIFHCAKQKDGVFLASYFNKIYYSAYDQSGKISLYASLPNDYNIDDILCKENYLWILTEKHGVLKMDVSSKKIEGQWEFRNKEEDFPVSAFYLDKNNKVWIGTQRGLYVLDPATGNFQLYLHSKSDYFSLPNSSVWSIVGDAHQNIWIGTFAGGLCYVNPDEDISIKTYTSDKSSLSHNLVSAFAEDGPLLWLGTEGGGLNCLDRRTDSFTLYKADRKNNRLNSNNVKSLALDFNKRLWIAMYLGGLDCFDTRTKTFRHFLNDPKNKNSLYVNNLRKIILEGDSGLWIAYQIDRPLISFYSFKKNTFTHSIFGDKGYVFDIHKDNVGNLWIVTNKDLYKKDKQTSNIVNVSSKKNEILNARSICTDEADNVWIGTVGRGIIKYDVSTSEFISYPELLSFNVHSVNSICPASSGYLWIGTNFGLFLYDIKRNTYRRFDDSDGLPGNVYYPLASVRGNSGNYYFGGTNGFTIMDARMKTNSQLEPKAVISEFYIDNVPAKSNFKRGNSGNEIILNHNQINFGFKFSSDNYVSPGKNRFKYRLKEYDDRWVTTDAFNRTAMYSKIPSGTYYFEVLAANNDGVWGDVPTVVKIRRQPAPWASWWAYLLYVIFGLAIATAIIYNYVEQRRLKLQLYVDDLNKQKKEEIHQSQLRFVTNISHDFKTPLSLILATLGNLKQEGIKQYYYSILHNNAQRLLNLVNELMDFKTIEHGKMNLQIQATDVNSLLTTLTSDFIDYAQSHDIQFDFSHDQALPDLLPIDKYVVERIVMNLLSNSFKYTKNEGEVKIATYESASKFASSYELARQICDGDVPTDNFLIVISDTGTGISKEMLLSIFDGYYPVNTSNLNQHIGTGIGLALVKSLVLLHKGFIRIYSEYGKGTDIVIGLPTDVSVYDKSELAETQILQSPFDDNTESFDMIEDIKEDILQNEKKRVLIVEDNNDLNKLLSDFLSPYYEIFNTSNGVEATEILQETDIELIISDIMMPLKDGITLCREVKADINTSHIPFILLSAKVELDSKIEGADSGADMYFEKPIDFNLLLLSIKNIFKNQQKLRDYYTKNYYVDSVELSINEQDNIFLKKLMEIIDKNLTYSNMDVNYISSELSMSHSKFYSKLKMLTGKSPVQFILNYKLKLAARMILEQDVSVNQVMEQIGIKSQSYFTNAFKKEFGETPSAFALRRKKKM
ncbi:MAG: two-component regulator propeller domain-containing protein [Paludibacteraceae bacterium]